MKQLVLLACALALLPGCAPRERAPQAGPQETPAVTDADLAVETVSAHYRALENDDKAGFDATCFPSSSIQFWWSTGRRYVTSYGVRWEYHHIEGQPKGYKVFFRRIQADGSQRGSPVPCTVRSENGRWLVYTSTQ
jgi:hypothetical protein